ncbi:MAG: TonB-dependent receptor plug domain-containing protein, partial [Gillisia sp.]
MKGTTTGAQTDFDGHYSIPAVKGDVLVFSFVGLKTAEYTVGNSNTIAVTMKPDSAQLDEVVVTALGIKRETKTLTYATQQVDSKELNITQNNDIKNALAGKVAGVQLNGSAGSQLNGTSKIRIRGAISLTSDNDALYVVDGVPGVDPSSIDMENVATINVLKGPNATALYGQRADSGVIEITTKKGSGKMAVEFASSAIFDKVAYLPKYQNLYGGGYEGDASFGIFGDESTGSLSLDSYPQMWQQFAGQRYLLWDNNYADESWGPKFDGQDYVPWYAWWPDSPYYGQTAKYTAQPDNIKNYYNT